MSIISNFQPVKEYRFYGFGNYYLSSLQQGLQAGHAITELFVNHDVCSDKYNQVFVWGKFHKTMVLLNGGNSSALTELHEFFKELEDLGMPYPFSVFHEDEQSLNGAITYVGIILPNDVYDLASEIRNKSISLEELCVGIPEWKLILVDRLNQYSLAH